MHRVHLVVHGRVQGVGFRWHVRREAVALGLTGWVRNRSDGSVEAEAQGRRDALDRFVDAVRRAPASAHVERMTVAWTQGDEEYPGFAIRD